MAVTSPEWTEGLYESLLTDKLGHWLSSVRNREIITAHVDSADQPRVLARYLYQ